MGDDYRATQSVPCITILTLERVRNFWVQFDGAHGFLNCQESHLVVVMPASVYCYCSLYSQFKV